MKRKRAKHNLNMGKMKYFADLLGKRGARMRARIGACDFETSILETPYRAGNQQKELV